MGHIWTNPSLRFVITNILSVTRTFNLKKMHLQSFHAHKRFSDACCLFMIYCVIVMLFARIQPLLVPVPSGSVLYCATIKAPCTSWATSRAMLGICHALGQGQLYPLWSAS